MPFAADFHHFLWPIFTNHALVDFSPVISIFFEIIHGVIVIFRYFDALKDIGNGGGSKTLFLQHGPSAVSDLQASLRNGLMTNMAMKR